MRSRDIANSSVDRRFWFKVSLSAGGESLRSGLKCRARSNVRRAQRAIAHLAIEPLLPSPAARPPDLSTRTLYPLLVQADNTPCRAFRNIRYGTRQGLQSIGIPAHPAGIWHRLKPGGTFHRPVLPNPADQKFNRIRFRVNQSAARTMRSALR
jgi:hypothetical protein